MLHRISYVMCGLLGLLLATPALAAEHGGRALLLSANGGAFNALDNLNRDGSADFKSGFGLGGGLTYLMTEHFGVRGNFTFARSQLQDAAAPILDRTEVNRYFYDADVQYRHPLRSGWTPYLFAGGGGVRIKPTSNNPSESAFSKGVGKAGLGLSYNVPNSRFAIGGEGTGRFYKWDRDGFDKNQLDALWSGGVSYRFNI